MVLESTVAIDEAKATFFVRSTLFVTDEEEEQGGEQEHGAIEGEEEALVVVSDIWRREREK